MFKEPIPQYWDEVGTFTLKPYEIYQCKSKEILWNKLLHFARRVPILRADDEKCEKIMDILKRIVLYAEDKLLYVEMYYDDETDELKVELTSDMSIEFSDEIYDLMYHAVRTFDHNNNDNTLLLSFPVFKIEQM